MFNFLNNTTLLDKFKPSVPVISLDNSDDSTHQLMLKYMTSCNLVTLELLKLANTWSAK